MAQVRWTLQAADDLDSIAEFIARDSPHYAQVFVIDVLAAIERLESFPLSGRIVPEPNNPALREIIMGNYRIVYRVKEGAVDILTIYHGRCLLDPSVLNENPQR